VKRYVLRLDRVAGLLCGLAACLYLLMALSEITNPSTSGMTESLEPYFGILVGVCWGAPLLARELESGTAEWSWSQRVPRGRWLVARAGPGLVLSAAGAAVVTVVTWLSTLRWTPALRASSMMTASSLASQGLAPVSFTVFAFCLGLASAALTSRVVPAIAITLMIQVAAAYAVPELAQDLAPATRARITGTAVPGRLTSGIARPGAVVTYVPDREFWLCEAAIAVVLLSVAVCLALAAWRCVRRFGS
jgi:hypothetical protein